MIRSSSFPLVAMGTPQVLCAVAGQPGGKRGAGRLLAVPRSHLSGIRVQVGRRPVFSSVARVKIADDSAVSRGVIRQAQGARHERKRLGRPVVAVGLLSQSRLQTANARRAYPLAGQGNEESAADFPISQNKAGDR